MASLGEEIEQDAAAARKRTGVEPLGPAAILAQDPTSRPKRLKKSPAPLFHAASKAMRHYLYEGFAWFVAASRTAAEKLQRGDPDPHFQRELPASVAVRQRVKRRQFPEPGLWGARAEVCPDG